MATPNFTKFNEQEYEYEMYLDSGAGQSDERRYYINPNAIVNLNIEETLADWVTRGTLVVYDSFNSLENVPDTPGSFGTGPKYVFRSDGNDILYVRFFPKLDKIDLEVDRVHWELVYKFAIYDVEDIDQPPGAQGAASASTKCKKFYFWDHLYQKMITNTLEYSTGLNNNSDSDGALETGIAMKEIIESALKPYQFDIKGNWLELVGGGETKNWDNGASKVFFTAPAAYSAYDSLMYVYNRHISKNSKFSIAPKVSAPRGGTLGSSDNDFCILSKERGPAEGDEGYFVLRPMSYYFSQAGKESSKPGPFQIERFSIQDYSNDKIPGPKYTPRNQKQDLQVDTVLGEYSKISNYRFVDISPFINSTKFINTPVCSFDFTSRTYKIEFERNTVEQARTFMTKKYISEVYKDAKSDPEKLFLLTLDENKKDRNIKPVYSLYGGTTENDSLNRQADGFQKLLKIGVFQNMCINFRVLGSTNREPGRFIAIDNEEGIADNNFNNKLYGQWFVINVGHIFEAGLYYNEITAVKVHRFKPLDVNFTGTI